MRINQVSGDKREHKRSLKRAFWEGFNSVFDFSTFTFTPEPYEQKPRACQLYTPMTTAQAWAEDRKAMRSDWETVGRDLRNAIKTAVPDNLKK